MIIAASRNASQYIYTICIPEYAKKCKNEGFFIIYQQIGNSSFIARFI